MTNPTTPERRRATDQLELTLLKIGVLCILIAAGITITVILTHTKIDALVAGIIGLFGGGGLLLMPTQRIILGLRALWRMRNGNGSGGSTP